MNLFPKLLVLFLLSIGLAVSAQKSDYSVSTGNFTAVRVKHSIPVDYRHSSDSSGIATFSADDLTAQALVFENKKGTLTISLDPATFNTANRIPTVTIRSNYLEKATNDGDSSLRILSVAPTPSLDLKLTGNGSLSVRDVEATEVKGTLNRGSGDMAISGKCVKAVLRNTSKGTIQAGNLIAEDVDCSITGTGTVDCHASKSLNIKGVGAGTLYYTGSPEYVRKNAVKIKIVDVDNGAQ